ncbi:uncharacterized protein ALTATR162_LOCUS2527 [Alternaria atra]|uniref:Uncharacterized protein n=1 Tax=Alternaria atra TaxID=119953 RepID=A0A8J2HYQ1_9PLEO|nr:uncharacterized protein ALTATR162_LOCUS2527 [Alternaria atra]CAG5150032.1 unnamed protein product [Alternaria atra]
MADPITPKKSLVAELHENRKTPTREFELPASKEPAVNNKQAAPTEASLEDKLEHELAEGKHLDEQIAELEARIKNRKEQDRFLQGVVPDFDKDMQIECAEEALKLLDFVDLLHGTPIEAACKD